MLFAQVGCDSSLSGSLIETMTGRELLSVGEGEIWEALFTSGGSDDPSKYLVVSREGTVEIFDVAQRQLVATVEPDEFDGIGALAVDRAGRYLATGSEFGRAIVFFLPALVYPDIRRSRRRRSTSRPESISEESQ